MRLRTRILIAVVIACSVINLFLCFYFTGKIRDLELESLQSRIEKSGHMMKLVTSKPLYNVDKETLRVNMETFFNDENMKSISLLESDTDIDIKIKRKFESSKGVDIKKSFDIYHNDLKLGKMDVVYSTSLIEQKLENFRNQMLFFTFIIISFLVVVLFFIVDRLLMPVTELTLAASDIASGNLDRDIDQGASGEIGELSRNFAAMRDALKEKIDDLAMSNRNLEREIFLKEINELKILKQSKVIASVNDFFQKSMLEVSYEAVAQIFIPIALEVIPGKYCFIGELNKDENDSMDILAASDKALQGFKILGRDKDSLVSDAEIRRVKSCVFYQGKIILTKDPLSHPDLGHLPGDQIDQIIPDSFLGVPMKKGSVNMGILGFAGKEGEYGSDDEEACEILAVAIVEALSLKKREDEKTKLEEMMIQSEKMISIGGLAAGMAHEINNPLAGILQNAQVIRNRLNKSLPANVSAAAQLGLELDDVQAYMEKRNITKMIDLILDAGKRAAEIVSNMLSFSRKSTSGFLAEDVLELLDKTLELAESNYDLKKKFDFKKIKIIKDYDPGIPKISCRASEIQQVFFNVLSNGAQAMMSWDKTLDPCFTIRVSRKRERVRVEIQDNGPGMKEETKKRIFDPFFTTKDVGEGTGLGLSVSYFIITENHKGSIEVYSKPSRGTTFVVELPAAETLEPTQK